MQNDCFPDSPPEWPVGPVSELAEVNPRYSVDKERIYPFIEMAAVGENFGGIVGLDRRKLEGSGLSRFRVGDTLFAKITPCPENGKVAFVDALPDEIGLGSTEFIVLSPRAETEPRFLYHLACSYAVRGRAAARMEGSTGRQRVPDEVFTKRLLVPIPSRPEQTSIARVLDAVDSVLRLTRAAIEREKDLENAILQRFFYAALGETAYADRPRRALPSGWSLQTTGMLLAGEPKNGVSPESSSQPPGTPTFSIGAIRDGRVDLNDAANLKYVRISAAVARKFAVHTGDVLVVRGNANPDLVGKAAIVSGHPEGCIYPDIVKRVVFRREDGPIVSPEYAILAWNHPVVHNQVLRRAKTSNGTLKINSRDVQQIVMPVPPEHEQAWLVEMVRGIETHVDAMRGVCHVHELLKRALLQDLLSGRVRLPSEIEAPHE